MKDIRIKLGGTCEGRKDIDIGLKTMGGDEVIKTDSEVGLFKPITIE